MKAGSILELMRSSPLVALRGRAAARPRARLWAKLECLLPGAMKDRVALYMIEQAEARGALRPGGLIAESSSGTMAEGLARVGALRGYQVIIVTDPRIDPITQAKLESLGARLEIVDTYHPEGGWQLSRLQRLREVLDAHPGAFWPRQYDSPDNAGAYECTAEQEILDELGDRVAALVGSVGSGGSLCGTARALRRRLPSLRVVAVDAVGSALFHQPDRRRLQSGHGNSIIPGNIDYRIIDEVHWIADGEAFQGCRELARREGLFTGGSSGAAYVAACWIAEQLPEDQDVVVLMPDRGDRYVETIYADAFLRERGLAGGEAGAAPVEIRYGLEVAERWSRAELPHDGSVPYYAPTVRRTADLARELGLPMRPPEHFVFVESNTTGTGALAVRRLLERGDRVTFLARDPGTYPFLIDPPPGLAVIPLETNETETVAARVEELRHEHEIDALLTFSEFYVPIAAEVARRMGMRYLSPEAARTCRSKPATRAALRAAGRRTPPFRVLASEEGARRAAAELSFPCVVKPPADSSSKGVLQMDGPESLLEHFRRLHAWRVNDRGQELSGEVLVEGLLTGPEVSVETVTLARGETVVVGITAKHLSPPPLFVEVGHDFPALLAADEAAGVEAEVRAALDAVGFDFGPAHTEVRLTPEGPIIVEINPRLAGGMIPELVRYATGIDLLEVFLEMLRGRPVSLTPVRAEHASIRFLLADRVGRLGGISGVEDAWNLDAVREVWIGKRQGAAVRPAEEAADRLGYVIASGPSRSQVLGAAAGALGTIRLDIDPPDAMEGLPS